MAISRNLFGHSRNVVHLAQLEPKMSDEYMEIYNILIASGVDPDEARVKAQDELDDMENPIW